MKSKQEYKEKVSFLGKSQTAMNVFVLLPTIMQLFLSVGMDLIWSLFLMLQVITNMRNYQRIIFPPSTEMMLSFTDSVVNFQITKQ